MKLTILISYFVIIQLFGLFFGESEFLSFNAKLIYLLLNFPIFGIVYNYNLWTLSETLEKENKAQYDKIAFKNPFTNKNRVITPGSLFSKNTIETWKASHQKIILTKWSFILMISSFIFMVPIMILC